MKNKILERVDDAIESMKPAIEKRMPYRKWKMHINLPWDDTFTILFEYSEDLSNRKDGKLITKYELSNRFWFTAAEPNVVKYKLIRFTNDKKEGELLKTEDVPLSGVNVGSQVDKELDSKKTTSASSGSSSSSTSSSSSSSSSSKSSSSSNDSSKDKKMEEPVKA
jgi:hypothetical protein